MAQEMSQCFFGIMILMYFIITVKSEVYHLLPAPSNTCKVDFHDCLTLSQFVSNSSNYLSKTTMLIFAPGSHAIESELIIENIYSFSMLAETTPLTQTEIVCYDHANFTFSHVSVVTVIGFKFSGCIGNQILSVSKFHLKKSTFYGGVKINDCGTVLTMAKTVSHLERVSFTFHHIIEQQTQNHTMIVRCTDICPGVNLYTNAIAITQSLFIGNQWRILYSKHDSDISILSSTFTSNEAYLGGILYVTSGSTINLNTCSFKKCKGDVLEAVDAVVTIIHSLFLNTLISHDIVFYTRDSALKTSRNNDSQLLSTRNTNLKVSHSEFIGNANNIILLIRGGSISIHHCQFIRTVASCSNTMSNSVRRKLMLSIRYNEFKSNNVVHGIVNVYESTDEPIISNNDFVDNNAVFDTYISSDCKLGLSLSPDSSRCIPCPDYWRGNLIGIVVAAFVAGLALVIVIFAFNMTIAVGTLNGILLYGNIIAANADIYFLPFSSPNFVTVFISWLSLDVGFDICFFKGMDKYDKAQIQLAFPVYIILLVIIVIILSECSTKFARIVGKGNPIAVLTTMILISYTKFFNVIIGSISLLYLKPAYGSRNLNITRFDQYKQTHPKSTAIDEKHYSMLIFTPIIFFIGVLYTTLVFSWQWLLLWQDKPIIKWVKYQKLQHFMEPHHAPYTSKHRYWTGLLLLVRVVLYFEGVLNFSQDRQIDLMATILIVTCLLLLKSNTSKRIYKHWLIDAMENAIYFNLIFFTALTWYCLNPGAQVNQSAIAYTFITITFILLVIVVVYHTLRYTRLYNFPFVHKLFMKLSSKLNGKEETENDVPEELDGHQPERAVETTVTRTIIELQEPLLKT